MCIVFLTVETKAVLYKYIYIYTYIKYILFTLMCLTYEKTSLFFFFGAI